VEDLTQKSIWRTDVIGKKDQEQAVGANMLWT